jgi:antitoxin component of RelBE/YafQ-DinJ toxin-antitoxin module
MRMKKPKPTEKTFIGLRVEADDLKDIDAMAKHHGVGRSTAVRMIIKKAIREEKAK